MRLERLRQLYLSETLHTDPAALQRKIQNELAAVPLTIADRLLARAREQAAAREAAKK